MPTYTYTARDVSGKLVSGSVALTNEKTAREYLRRHELFVTHLAAAEPEGRKAPILGRRVRLQDLVVFSRQFASMVRAGMPIVQIFDALTEQTESPLLKRALDDVRHDVESGASLSAAIGSRPRVFPEMFSSMVRAGEASGTLEDSLEVAATQFDKEQELAEKIRSALLYPALVLGITVVIVGLMLAFIVPVFADIYRSLHAELPWMTQLLVNISYVLTHDALIVLAGIAALPLLLRWAGRTRPGRLFFDRLKLSLPVFGKLHRKVAIARFVRTLAAMLESGLSLPQGLEIAASVAGNLIIADAARAVGSDLVKGHALSARLERCGEFPRMVTRMAAVGEASGTLDRILDETAHYYEREVEYVLKRLTTLLEPLLTVLLGIIVGVVTVSLYLPIFGLGQALLNSK